MIIPFSVERQRNGKMGRGRRKNTNNVVSPKSHGDDSSSVVVSTRHQKPVHYALNIQSFSLLKDALASSQRQRIESKTFNAGCYEWKLALYPNGDERRNVSNHISLYLPNNYEYTWKLNNFSQLDTTLKESDLFTLESYHWKIRLYPSGDLQAKPGFLSMFLMFDGSNELPQVDCWFGYGGMKVGRGWGAADFSSLIDLKEPTKGYLLNDTLVVEVKINGNNCVK
ncbi:unnamed protein product [Citrullus colocynthis]|uniref:MATH domain-containing protein n=1 Tax=Citrullus colocynthis TaxID=252529 RepID=A0ABP0XTF5_9ROSI